MVHDKRYKNDGNQEFSTPSASHPLLHHPQSMKVPTASILATLMAATAVMAAPTTSIEKRNGDGSVHLASNDDMAIQKHYLQLSYSAYCSSVIPGGDLESCPYCDAFDNIKLIKTFKTKKYDTNAMVVRDDERKEVVAVFRGTDSIRGWIADFTVLPVSYPPVKGAYVHKGFYATYMDVADEITSVVLDQAKKYPDYNIAVTGHSLGGATSMLGAMDLYQRGVPAHKLKLYTQGGPRVGNKAFAEYVLSTKVPVTRLINKMDSVPHVPHKFAGFRHPGEEYWIKSNSTTRRFITR
ncbi:lipase [Lichtheimia corymbifera JMRC:FSU:9682]|uniref:Lipase n=1 Tax=Lichtheimia corymbifera JMRC:FSU:9682 TaxID=1263082 RepID=A0A068RU13_9FUNG|nr:lipase [Lichtheimia corymbifera JMRC:FSU:9682]